MEPEYKSVSWVCPLCGYICGHDKKYDTYDAVRVKDPSPGVMQYAHKSCVDKSNARRAK